MNSPVSTTSSSSCYYMMSFLFTGHGGGVLEVAPEDLPPPVSPHTYPSLDGTLAVDLMTEVQQGAPDVKPAPPIVVSIVCDTPDELVLALPMKKAKSRRVRSVSDRSGNGSGFEPPKTLFTYNDYGELVDVEKLKPPVNSADLTVTETLRLILRAYHNKVSY
jgi:hypothetical protein